MKSHKIDSIVKDRMASRTIVPSKSAWSHLNSELDQVKVSNRKPLYRYIGYAASLLLTASLATFVYTNSIDTLVYEYDVVKTPVLDTKDLIQPNMENLLPQETVVVKTEEPVHTEHISFPNSKIMADVDVNEKVGIALTKVTNNRSVGVEVKQRDVKEITMSSIAIDSDALLMAATQGTIKKEKSLKQSTPKEFTKNSIQINSDALLYAVSNPIADMQVYYEKYDVDRDDVLKHIQKELTNLSLAVDASILLASVEKSIDEETFKNRFMQVIKGKITDLANVFSSRNN